LILRTLLLEAGHGHAIAKAIEFRSDDVLQAEQGSLYPAAAPAHQAGMDFVRGGHVGELPSRQVLPSNGKGAQEAGR
jgi:DNA-binding PadR family transcriptional regulator